VSGRLGDGLRNAVFRVKTNGMLSPKQIGLFAGTVAKTRHQQLITQGVLPEASIRYVDGVVNAPETSVKISTTHPGTIEYKGSLLAEAARYAWTIAREASTNIPRRASQFPAGTFSQSWRLFVDGRESPPEKIPATANEIIVVNVAPYSRFLEQHVGAHRQRAAYMISEIASRATKTRFQGLSVRRQFVTLAGVTGVPFDVPYYLKGRERRLRLIVNAARRRDRGVGAQMLYPAVVIATKGI
jgi:hypothetical protein